MTDTIAEPPLPQAEVMTVVAEHLDRFAQVITSAWSDFQRLRALPKSPLNRASAGTRGMMLVTDLVGDPAHRMFAGLDGVVVKNRYGRPWVNLGGGRVQVRFRSLTPTLQLCPSDTERQVRLAYHLGDPCLPGMPDATILTAGYVLDASCTRLTGTYLDCHLGDEPHYSIALPRSAAAPRQLPLVPLSAPVIRSTRTAVRTRLDRGSAR